MIDDVTEYLLPGKQFSLCCVYRKFTGTHLSLCICDQLSRCSLQAWKGVSKHLRASDGSHGCGRCHLAGQWIQLLRAKKSFFKTVSVCPLCTSFQIYCKFLMHPILCYRGQNGVTADRSVQSSREGYALHHSLPRGLCSWTQWETWYRVGRNSENRRMVMNKWPFYHSKCFYRPPGLSTSQAKSLHPQQWPSSVLL